MDSDPGGSCTSVIGSEIILFISSLVMVLGALYLIRKEIIDMLLIRARRLEMVLLSSAFDLFLPLMWFMFTQIDKKENFPRARIQVILPWIVIVEIIRQQTDASCTGKKLRATTYTTKSLASMYQVARKSWIIYCVYRYAQLPDLRIILIVLCASSIVYEVVNCVVFVKARGSYLIGKNPELIGSHVRRVLLQHNLRTTPLASCDYVVLGEETHETEIFHNGYQIDDTEGLLTIGSIFRRSVEQDKKFTAAHPRWRDNCLSFALAKMLVRRFAKLPLHEVGSRKALDFVLMRLIDLQEELPQSEGQQEENLPQEVPLLRGQQDENISQEEINPIKRLFNILNDELKLVSAFLHSEVFVYHFFGWVRLLDFSVYLIFTCAMMFLLAMRFTFVGTKDKECQCIFRLTSVLIEFDPFIKCFLVGAFIYLESIKRCCVCSALTKTLSDLRTYAKNPTEWMETDLSFFHDRYVDMRKKFEFKETFWRHSVLDIEVRSTIFECLPKVIKWRKEKVDRIEITIDVKESVLTSLRESGGRLTNGESALRSHKMIEHLNWACEPNGSTIEAILVWHIATTLYSRENPPSWFGDPSSKEREVASTLSTYCHYLVASHPELLPDDVKCTKRVYGDLKEEILSFYCSSGHQHPISDRYNRIFLATNWSENSILGKGIKLTKELIKHARDEVPVWRMLAEFWAEMMLFIAPSENVEGHEKVLYKKEFITQIWVLLMHAGIDTRPNPYEVVVKID